MRTKVTILNVFYNLNSFRVYLIFTWVFGLLMGLHIFPRLLADLDCQLLFTISAQRRFPLLCITSLLPFAVTHVCLCLRKQYFLLVLCALKSSLFGFALFILYSNFLSGTWLAVFLYIFSDIVNNCLLLWFWLNQARYGGGIRRLDTAIYIAIQFSACVFDELLVTPVIHKIY